MRLGRLPLSAAVLLSSLAAATEVTHQLQVMPDPAALCPDAMGLRRLVAERLGSDPFGPEAPTLVVVRFEKRQGQLTAELQLKDSNGQVKGERLLTSSAADCSELAKATTLAVAILIDPQVLTRPEPQVSLPLPNPQPSEAPVVTNQPTEPPMIITERPNRWEREVKPPPPTPDALVVGLGAGAAFAQVPSAAGTLLVDLAWERPWFALGLRTGVTLPGSLPVGTGAVQAMAVDVGPLLCLRYGRIGLCGVARFGVQHAWAQDLSGNTGPQSAPAANVGLSPFIDIPLGSVVRVRLFGGAQVNTSTAVLEVGGAQAWRTPLFSFSVGASLAFRVLGDELP